MSCPLNSFPANFAFYIEPTIGLIPVSAAAWVTAEGAGEAWRLYVEAGEVTDIVGRAAVANADFTLALGHHLLPHQGLPTADGATMTTRLWSNSQAWVDGAPVVETGTGWLIGHALGGQSLGSHATVTVVNSQTSFDLSSVAGLAVGQVIGFDDLGDLGNVRPARILTIAGSTVTIDRVMPFTVAVGDHVIGAETSYFEPDGMGTTITVLRTHNTDVWTRGGAHLFLTTLTLARGEQPKLEWGIMAARGIPPGTDGAVSLPAFVDEPEGRADVSGIGLGSHVRLVAYGNTSVGEYSVHEAGVEFGVPIAPNDTITENNSGSPGRECYRAERGDTVLTLTVKVTNGEQTRWVERQEVAVTIYQAAAPGYSWCLDGVRGFMMGPPVPKIDGRNLYEIKIQLTDDMSKVGQLARSKIVLARY